MENFDVRKLVSTNYGDWLSQWGSDWKTQVASLREKFGAAIEEVRMPTDYPTDVPIIYVQKEKIVEVLSFMKLDSAFDYSFLADLTATDEETDLRFEIVYNLLSLAKHWRIRVKVRVREGDEVPTIITVWKGANWQEREVWDMFGVKFSKHPDLRRVLMDFRFVGHPLRKDYPLRGYQIFPTPEPVDPTLLE